MSVCWPTTLIEPSGKLSTRQGTRPWCPLCASLHLHLTKRLLTRLPGEKDAGLHVLSRVSFTALFTLGLTLLKRLTFSSRTEQLYQNVLALWHRSHINMKSVVSWHYLTADIRAIRNWNVASVCLFVSLPISDIYK